MKFTAVTLFPELIQGFVQHGLLGQAQAKGLAEVRTLNPRRFTTDPHQTVDDRSFGGGDGMVMKYEPLAKAVEALRADGPCQVVVMSPQGERWSQAHARAWAQVTDNHYVLICGRYAGIDQRLTARHADFEISLGDFVLNGGEIAACAMIESVVRLIPGALGNEASAQNDSFERGLLECPQFTRPREVDGMAVPDMLLSGNHALIKEFESAVSMVRTKKLRPDLVPGIDLQKSYALLRRLSDKELELLGLSRGDLP